MIEMDIGAFVISWIKISMVAFFVWAITKDALNDKVRIYYKAIMGLVALPLIVLVLSIILLYINVRTISRTPIKFKNL